MLLIILSALLCSLSFHPVGLHFLAWIGLVPMLFAVENKRPRQAFMSGIFFGGFFSMFSLFWIVFLQIETNIKLLMLFGMLLMFLYIGVYYGVAFLIANRLGTWSLPFAAAGLEFVKGLGELGFPWLSFGYSQARYPLVIQQASIYGVYGISCWLVLVNVAAYHLIRKRTIQRLAVLLAVFFAPLIYGSAALHFEHSGSAAREVSVGVIQPNIDPNLKFTARMRNESLDRLIALSRECHENVIRENGDGLDLIIWPETAVPAFIKSSAECRALVAALCDTINVPIFTGTPIFNYKTREVHNGAVLFVPNQGIRDEYIKIHLVPFGEHIPFDKYVPLFRKIDLGEGDYAPGSEYTVFNTGSVKFSCLVCFESIFPELSREFV
jgi:apolipoprotein N-acyltransferase